MELVKRDINMNEDTYRLFVIFLFSSRKYPKLRTKINHDPFMKLLHLTLKYTEKTIRNILFDDAEKLNKNKTLRKWDAARIRVFQSEPQYMKELVFAVLDEMEAYSLSSDTYKLAESNQKRIQYLIRKAYLDKRKRDYSITLIQAKKYVVPLTFLELARTLGNTTSTDEEILAREQDPQSPFIIPPSERALLDKYWNHELHFKRKYDENGNYIIQGKALLRRMEELEIANRRCLKRQALFEQKATSKHLIKLEQSDTSKGKEKEINDKVTFKN